MVFSSPIFLFLFLPAVLALYWVLPRALRNAFLLAVSLLFYAWGEGVYTVIMLFSTGMNYLAGLMIGNAANRRKAHAVLVISIVANLLLLGLFKYANFVADTLNILLSAVHLPLIQIQRVHLPIGISFYTFHAMSYVIDVYRGESKHQKSPVNTALYIALFPQLVAGPIIRYHDVAAQLISRTVDLEDMVYGLRRFICGLAKKVLIANTLAVPADAIFALPPESLGAGLAWFGILAYALQIYFDFSGYSDMAIGLGRLFGFRFRENFQHPYESRSMREFWRRWHISLSTWFRDYLYIPLGGNRHHASRVYFNLVLVFFLCGLWHGASWTFVLWGLTHGIFLTLERLGLERRLARLPRAAQHAYVLAVITLTWVLFRAEAAGQAGGYLMALVGLHEAPHAHALAMYTTPLNILILLCGIAGSISLPARIGHRFAQWAAAEPPAQEACWLRPAAACAAHAGWVALFLICAIWLAAGTYNPFIYFRF